MGKFTPHVGRLLVITLSNIGDVVLTTPVMEALSARFPKALIDVVGDPRSLDLLADAPYIGELFLRNKRAGYRAQLALIQRLRRQRYRVVVDLRTPFLPYLLRADLRLLKPRPAIGQHAVRQHFAALAPLLPLATPPPCCRVHLGPEATSEAQALLRDLPGQNWLALAPGANWPGKKWPHEHFKSLLQLALHHFDAAIILGSREEAMESQSLSTTPLPTLSVAGRTTLRVAAAVIARARAFVGNDSGLGHMAAAVGVPCLTVFGPGNPGRYRPWGPQARIIMAPQLDLAHLAPAAVFAELMSMLTAHTEGH